MKYPICCGCCEDNQQVYFDRILKWREQLSPLDDLCEYHVFNDGKIWVDPSPLTSLGINVHELLPKLGRTTSNIFQGYKRSFLEMCKMFPKGFAVIENDVKINNIQIFEIAIRHSGCFCGYSTYYHFIETATMVLNDPEAIQRFIGHYGQLRNLYEPTTFEQTLSRLARFQIAFKTVRKENRMIDDEGKYDFICQNCG